MKSVLKKINYSVIISLVLLLFTIQQSPGQADSIRNPEQYLFTKFTLARIATKVGKDLNLVANYNIVTEVLVFQQRGQIYDLADFHNVDTIYFKDHVFVPVGKIFYEIALSGPASLLIRHTGTLQSPPKPAAYGGTSEVSSSNYVNYMQLGGTTPYRINKETSLYIKETDLYFIGKGKEIKQFHNERGFISCFPEIKSELKRYIRGNKIHFDREEELVKVVSYCNSLPR